jgi:hypothetical protein
MVSSTSARGSLGDGSGLPADGRMEKASPESPRPRSRHAVEATVSTHSTGLRLPEKLGLDSWCRIGKQISLIINASACWLGDWLIYGQASFPDRYRQAMTGTTLDYQTLRNYAYVARRFPQPRRRTDLSFQHHAGVTTLGDPDQEIWLSRAETLKWPVHEFRKQLRAAKVKVSASAEPDEVSLTLSISPDQYQRWSAAAGEARQELLEWTAKVLDRASAVSHTLVPSPLPPVTPDAIPAQPDGSRWIPRPPMLSVM